VISTEEQTYFKYQYINLSPTELLRAGYQKLYSEIQKLMFSAWKKRKFIAMEGITCCTTYPFIVISWELKITSVISDEILFCHLHTKCHAFFLWLGKQNSRLKLVVFNIGVGSSVMKQNFRPKIGVTTEIAVTHAKKKL
jgi:hypothetical protein